jgi:hypothetical protein
VQQEAVGRSLADMLKSGMRADEKEARAPDSAAVWCLLRERRGGRGQRGKRGASKALD